MMPYILLFFAVYGVLAFFHDVFSVCKTLWEIRQINKRIKELSENRVDNSEREEPPF